MPPEQWILLSVFTSETAVTPDGRPLHAALVERAREEGLAGATVLRGVEGFGAAGRLLSSRFPDASPGLPLVIEILDTEERVGEFLPIVTRLANGELVVRQLVSVMPRPRPSAPLDDPSPRPVS